MCPWLVNWRHADILLLSLNVLYGVLTALSCIFVHFMLGSYHFSIDGHHKLVRWGLVTHGGIDGYSRLVGKIYVKFKSVNNNQGYHLMTQSQICAFSESSTHTLQNYLCFSPLTSRPGSYAQKPTLCHMRLCNIPLIRFTMAQTVSNTSMHLLWRMSLESSKWMHQMFISYSRHWGIQRETKGVIRRRIAQKN